MKDTLFFYDCNDDKGAIFYSKTQTAKCNEGPVDAEILMYLSEAECMPLCWEQE